MATTSRQLIDSKRAISILNSRKAIGKQHVEGAKVLLEVQSVSLLTADQIRESDVKRAREPRSQYFDTYIINLKANSIEAISRKENKALFTEAMKAESAGEQEKADELFNQWLNACQISFNMIANANTRKYEKGDEVKCKISEVDTEAGHKAIIVKSMDYVSPVAVADVKFDITDLLAVETPAVAEENTVSA